MDPEGRSSQVLLLLRLLGDTNALCERDRETINKWELPETRVSSAHDSLIKMENEIFLLEKAKAVNNLSPSLLENLEEEIIRRKDEWGDDWILDLLRGIIFKKMKEVQDLENEARTRAQQAMLESEATRTTSKDDKVRVHCLKKQLAQKLNAVHVLETRVRTLTRALRNKNMVMARKLRKKDSEMALKLLAKESEMVHKLGEKDSQVAQKLGKKVDLLLELNCKKEEADKVQLEEAHRLKCEALRLRALRAEELNASLSKETKRAHRIECDALRVRALQAEELNAAFLKENESLQIAFRDQEAKCNHLEKGVSETRLRSVGNTRLAVWRPNMDKVMCPMSKQCDLSRVKLESNSEPQHGRDNPQTNMDLKRQQVGFKRLRDGRQNVVLRTRSIQGK